MLNGQKKDKTLKGKRVAIRRKLWENLRPGMCQKDDEKQKQKKESVSIREGGDQYVKIFY